MTKKQKKWLTIGGIIAFVIIVLLLLNRKAGANVINNEAPIQMGNVDIPGITLPPRGTIALTLPGLPNDNPYNFNAISPCMCNPNAPALSNDSGLSITFENVTNEANAGPTIYNYSGGSSSNSSNPWANFAAYTVDEQ